MHTVSQSTYRRVSTFLLVTAWVFLFVIFYPTPGEVLPGPTLLTLILITVLFTVLPLMYLLYVFFWYKPQISAFSQAIRLATLPLIATTFITVGVFFGVDDQLIIVYLFWGVSALMNVILIPLLLILLSISYLKGEKAILVIAGFVYTLLMALHSFTFFSILLH